MIPCNSASALEKPATWNYQQVQSKSPKQSPIPIAVGLIKWQSNRTESLSDNKLFYSSQYQWKAPLTPHPHHSVNRVDWGAELPLQLINNEAMLAALPFLPPALPILVWVGLSKVKHLSLPGLMHYTQPGWVPSKKRKQGHMSSSVGWASDFGSGHDLVVREFEPRMGLCVDSSEPGACFGFCGSLSLCPSPAHTLSLSVSQN